MKHFLAMMSMALIGCCALIVGARGVGDLIRYPFSLADRQPIPLAPPYDVESILPTVIPDGMNFLGREFRTRTGERIMAGLAHYSTSEDVFQIGVILHDTPQHAAETLGYNAGLPPYRHHSLFLDSAPTPFLFYAGFIPGISAQPLCLLQYINNQRWVITLEASNCTQMFGFMRSYTH